MTRKLHSTPAFPAVRSCGRAYRTFDPAETRTVRAAALSPAANRAARSPAAKPSKEAQSATSWMWRTLPQEKTPSTEVMSVSSTTAPPVSGDSSIPARFESSFSGMSPTERRRVSQGMTRSVPATGARRAVDLGHDDALDAVPAADLDDRRSELERDRKVHQALPNVALEPARPRQDLEDALDRDALEGQAAGHDEADIARAQDHGFVADAKVLEIDEILGRAGGEDPGRPRPRDLDHLARPLAAAHGQDDRPGPDEPVPLPGVDAEEPVGSEVEDHGPRLDLDGFAGDVLDEPFGVLGAADRLLV